MDDSKLVSSFQYQSLASLRSEHEKLMETKREEISPLVLDLVAQFIVHGRKTGALLDTSIDRQAAQSMLDYWDNILSRAGQHLPDSTLNEFDPEYLLELNDEDCPYLGLDAFREGNENHFYGRQLLIQTMLEQLQTNTLLVALGPSGSGKSSVILAGLLPALKMGGTGESSKWHYLKPMVPGSNPLANLAEILKPEDMPMTWIEQQVVKFQADSRHLLNLIRERLIEYPQNSSSVLVIDQFEELFTLCTQDDVRQSFASNLIEFILEEEEPHSLILTMRSDFEPQISALDAFYNLFQNSVINVPPLQLSELRDAIEKPAEMVGLKFEENVVDALLKDILGEPAALPLLQFTLLKLWENRQRNRVTWQSYLDLKGGRLALAKSADTFFENLIPENQMTVKRILLYMVKPGEGLEVTSSRVRITELLQLGEDPSRIKRMLEQLIEAHLVRISEGDSEGDQQVEIAHEALVRNWPRLVDWLEDEREGLRRRLRLTTSAEEWRGNEFDESVLLRGRLLAEAQEFLGLNTLEAQFVEASFLAEEEDKVRDLLQARQLANEQRKFAEEQQKRAEDGERSNKSLSRYARILTMTAALLVVSLLIAISLGYVANQNSQQATLNEQSAVNAKATTDVSLVAEATARADAENKAEQLSTAAAGQMALAEAEAMARQEADQNASDLAIALATSKALAFAEIEAREAADAARLDAEVKARRVKVFLLASEAEDQLNNDTELGLLLAIEAVNISLSGAETPLSFAEEALYLALQKLQLQTNLSGHTDFVLDVTFNGLGDLIGTVGKDSIVKIWDVESGQEIDQIVDIVRANTIAFSPNNELMVVGTEDGYVDFRVLKTYGRIQVLQNEFGAVSSLNFNRAGNLLAVTYEDGDIQIVDVSDPTEIDVKHIFFSAHRGSVHSGAFDSDGSRFASVGEDGRLVIWHVEQGISIVSIDALLDEEGERVAINAVAFHPDDEVPLLITGSEDGTVRLWNSDSLALIDEWSGHASTILDVAFNYDGGIFNYGE